MKMVTQAEIRQIDAQIIEDLKMPEIILMENVGISIIEGISDLLNNRSKITIVCGIGNNGGDGFVVARQLFTKGYNVRVCVVGDINKITGNAKINLDILKALEVKLLHINDKSINHLNKIFFKSDIVIDAIFGIGLTSEPMGLYKETIDIMNDSQAYIVSIDLPSGVDSDTSKIYSSAIKAKRTIAIAAPKCGNILFPGVINNGELIVKTIGIPKSILESESLKYDLIDLDLIKGILPKRYMDSHKGSYGKADIIAGSLGMTGAAILVMKSALRAGVGLLRLYIPESLNLILTTSVPEAITVPLKEIRKGVFGIDQIMKIIDEASKSDVIGLGPGLSVTPEIKEVVRQLLNEVDKPMIIDADGLNALAGNLEWLETKRSEIVLTPHLGEMSRLTGVTIDEIKENPIKIASEFSKKHDVIVVLKGSRTIIASPDNKIYINTTGNPGMATAGSGDVLTGIITALVAQNLTPLEASVLGVYLHGLSGNKAAERKGEHGLIASDIIASLTYGLKDIMNTGGYND